MKDFKTVKEKFESIEYVLDERAKRIWAAIEAQAIGWGGVSKVAEATGMSRARINRAIAELKEHKGNNNNLEKEKRIRRVGGGRKKIEKQQQNILLELEGLVEPATRGEPQSPLKGTCKSTQNLAEELKTRGYKISARKVAGLLYEME